MEVVEEKKKMGRPTDDKKNHEIKSRMSDKYMEKLAYCQKKTGLTRADVIRFGIDKIYDELKK